MAQQAMWQCAASERFVKADRSSIKICKYITDERTVELICRSQSLPNGRPAHCLKMELAVQNTETQTINVRCSWDQLNEVLVSSS